MENPFSSKDYPFGTASCDKKYKAYKPELSIKWNDLQNSLILATEQKNSALVHVKGCLGYIPDDHILFPHLSYVQILLKNHFAGVISQKQFTDEIVLHIKQIRNDDMKKGGWVQGHTYTSDMRRVYKEFLPEFKDLARSRLCGLLRFAPALKYSLAAEIFLRTLFEKSYYYADLPYCNLDFKAATVVNYRKSYYLFGEAAADLSGLFALNLDPFALDGGTR